MEERLSCFAARHTGRVWLRKFALFSPGVILVRLRQMKFLSLCLSLNIYFCSLECCVLFSSRLFSLILVPLPADLL